MKEKIFLKLSICFFIFSSCAYKPIYKKNTVFTHKINILVKSNDYDKKIPLLMKASLNQKLNSKKSLVVDKNIKNKTSIRVIGINNLTNLENVLNDLKSQVLVYGVTLKKVEGDTLDILLSHFGKTEDLKNLLNINDDFKGIDNSPVKVVSYKYNNT